MGRKASIFIGILFAATLLASTAPARDTGQKALPDNSAGKTGLKESYGKLPLYFIKNNGQIDGKVRYYEKSAGHAVYFTDEGLYINLLKRTANVDNGITGPQTPDTNIQSEVIRLGLSGSSRAPEIEAVNRQEGAFNYLIGNDRSGWRTGIPAFGALVYKDVYKGVDVKYHGNNSELEYDVIVRPGANPSAVRFFYEGVKGLKAGKDGGLEIALAHGTINQKKPFIYQTINGKKVEVAGGFELLGAESGRHSYGFQVASYDKGQDLIIDPSLVFSTYLGGVYADYGNSVAIDSSGNAYITGSTDSTNFPLSAPLQGAIGGNIPVSDVFVTKLNASGSALVYSTYLGGVGSDFGYGIAVDSSGNAYVTGHTTSADFPTAAPLYGTYSGATDAFVAKINSAGSALVYSTYIGGTRSESANAIALDLWNNAYIAGYTTSSDFPTVSPLQTGQMQPLYDLYGNIVGYSTDAFVTKINAGGGSLGFSTFLGGAGGDNARAIAARITMDPYGALQGGVYVTGDTSSTNFPTASPFYATNSGAPDVFVTKYNPTGSALVYSTYLGGTAADYGYAIAVDPAGNAFITGNTFSTNFPTATPIYGPRIDPYGGYLGDAFVTKLNAAGSALSYSTYLGGTGQDLGYDIAVDNIGTAYVTGYTASVNFPVVSPLYPTLGGGYDAFVTKLNTAGSALSFSTYLGGSGNDFGRSIVVDALENAYVAGDTYSTNFPTASPAQPSNAGNYDVFAAKVSTAQPIDLVVSAFILPSSPAPITVAPGVTFLARNTVTNTGTGSSTTTSSTMIYLSADSNITTADTGIGERYVSGLAAGASSTGDAVPIIPLSTTPGVYYLGTYADAENVVPETNESNNATAMQVTVGGYVDLIMSTLSSPTKVPRGASMPVGNTAKNNGTATVTNFNIRFYLSTDRVITTADTYLGVRFVNTDNLAPGGTNSQATSILIPATVAPRKYYIGVIVDVGNAVPESNETNNTRFYGPVTVY